MADTSFTSKALNTPLPQITDAPLNLIASNYHVSGTSGVWNYIMTAMNGGETLASSGIAFTNTVNSGVNVSFTTVADATDYRLYRSGAGYTGYLLVGNSISGSPIRDSFNTTIAALQNYYIGQNTTAFESRYLGSKATKIYQANGVRTLFKEAVLANNHYDVLLFSLYVVPSGESPCAGNRIFNNVSLDINETKILSLNTVLEGGDAIYAQSSDIGYIPGYGAVSLKISGIEISDN